MRIIREQLLLTKQERLNRKEYFQKVKSGIGDKIQIVKTTSEKMS